MSDSSDRADGDPVGDLLDIADVVAEPPLAQSYAYLAREGDATVDDMMDDLDLAQETAETAVNRLIDVGIVTVAHEDQPRRYTAREIDLQVTLDEGERAYTITPALFDAIGRRDTDDLIDSFIDRHGVAGLAKALTYAIVRERGEVTHRLLADDLDIPLPAAEMILEALRPVVHDHYGAEASEAPPDEVDGDESEAADDA